MAGSILLTAKYKREVANRFGKVIKIVLIAVAILVAVSYVALQTSVVQTYVAEKVLDSLNRKFNGKITVGRVFISFFNSVLLQDVTVKDDGKKSEAVSDTLFHADKIVLQFSLRMLLPNSGPVISRAAVSGGEFNLVIEDETDTLDGVGYSNNLSRIFRLAPDGSSGEPSKGKLFEIRTVQLTDFAFNMYNLTEDVALKEAEGGVNWYDMSVTGINFLIRGMKMVDGVMYGHLVEGSFRERSGFNCRRISGYARVGGGLTSIDELVLMDDHSDIYIDNYSMLYDSTEAFSDYVNKVRMSLTVSEPCYISMKTIGYFAPTLGDMDLLVSIQDHVEGTVADLYSQHLKVGLPDYGISFDFSGGISGLPDIYDSFVDARITDLEFTAGELARMIPEFTGGKPSETLERMAPGSVFRFNGSFIGKVSDIDGTGRVTSNIGNAKYELNLKGLGRDGGKLGLKGKVSTEHFGLGALTGNESLGELTFRTRFDALIASDIESSSIVIDTIAIDKFGFNGYDYSSINGMGRLENNRFDGRIISRDPNLNFLFQGVASLKPMDKDTEYKFYLNVGYADLYALNFDRRGRATAMFSAYSDITQQEKGEINGQVNIMGLQLNCQEGLIDVGNISVRASNEIDDYKIDVKSDIINAEYSGTGSVVQFIKDLEALAVQQNSENVLYDDSLVWSGNTYSLNVSTGDTRGVFSYVKPGFYLAKNSFLTLNVNENGLLEADVKSQRIAMDENYLKDFSMNISTPDTTLSVTVNSSEALMSSIMFRSPRVSLAMFDNSAYGRIVYGEEDAVNSGRLDFTADFLRDSISRRLGLGLRLWDSEFVVNGTGWNLDKSRVFYSGDRLSVDSLRLHSGAQSILVNTLYDEAGKDTLNVSLDSFDLASLNVLSGGQNYDFKGELSGSVKLIDMFGDIGLLADVKGSSISIASRDLGDLTVMSRWDQERKRFNIYLKNSLEGKNTINVVGFYRTKDRYLGGSVAMRDFSVAYLSPMLSSFLAGIDGTVSGDISVGGPLDKLSVTSNAIRLDNVSATIDYTKVTYTLNGSLSLGNDGIVLNKIDVRDRFGNRGVLAGGISYDYFKNIRFGLDLRFNGLECINISPQQADPFYGKAYATGMLSLTGPMNNLRLYANASTKEKTSFHIPISSTAEAGVTDILTFKDYSKTDENSDPYEEMISQMKEKIKESTNMVIDLHLNITPEAVAHVELDSGSGNGITGSGKGVLDIHVEPEKDLFEIRGDYTLDAGNFHYVALNIVTRDFIIDQGSSIQFNGDVMKSNLNIKAIYATKAAIEPLIGDNSSVASRRAVNCGLELKGQLMNPTMKFSIDIPDLNPMVRSSVENALSTDDKIQKQFLALILYNGFLPDEQSSVVNNSSLLYSSVTEIMSGQLNSILQKLDIPLDLGVNYQQTEQGTDVFDVAVSTQLFNNRVLVNGNIGNRQNMTTGNNGVVGDIDIEIKLDKKGALRLNLFSHSADQYSSYLDQSQRSGVGVTYQQEFSTFKELWRNLFWSKRRKRVVEEYLLNQMMEQRSRRDKGVVIEVGKEE